MQRLARTLARLLELRPDQGIRGTLTSPSLEAALLSLVAAAGARWNDPSETPPDAALVELSGPPAPLVPPVARDAASAVSPGAPVVVIIHGLADNPSAAAQTLGPLFDLWHVHGEAVADAESPSVILRGTRRPAPNRELLKHLRGLGHAMEASVLIGRDGLSAGLVASARDALARHGLIKAHMNPRARLDKQDAAVELAWAAGGQLVQRIGKTALIFRPDVPLAPAVK